MEGERLPLFGEYVLDTRRGCLLRAGRPVHLRPQAYRALGVRGVVTGRVERHGAIELAPGLALAHAEYAQFLAVMTRHAEALSENKRAQELDPLSVRLKRQNAWLLYLARRTDEGLTVLRETLNEPPPPHYELGFMYEAKGLHEDAIREFREVIASNGESTSNLCYLAGALAVAGKKEEALQILDRLSRSKEYVSPTELAAVYARLKDTEATITLLEKAYSAHDPQLQFLNVDPFLDYLRADPRYQDLRKRVGLSSRVQS